MCVALTALDASIRVQSVNGERRIPIAGFHRLPGSTPEIETNLKPSELILSIDLPSSPYAGHSCYLKVRDRPSYDFALVSVAAALEIDTGVIRSARIVLGGVAHKPWRTPAAEQLLIGKPPDAALFEAAGQAAVAAARPHRQNAFKVELARCAVARALAEAGGLG
jgi:xanthine dehydrogenase YagS FAD-binding subunit